MKTTIRAVIAANLTQYMTGHPYAGTQATLAAHSAVPKVKISRILDGAVDSDVDTLAALASALGVPSSALLADPSDAKDRTNALLDKLLSLPLEARAKISRFIDSVATDAQPHAEHRTIASPELRALEATQSF